MGLQKLTEIYKIYENLNIKYHRISWDPLRRYSFWLRGFEKEVTKIGFGTNTQDILARLKRFGYQRLTTPLPADHLCFSHQEIDSVVNQFQVVAKHSHPRLYTYITELHPVLEDLFLTSENPLFTKLLSLIEPIKTQEIAVLVKSTQIATDLRDVLAIQLTNNNITVVTESQLRGTFLYDYLLVIGSSRWYQNFIFSSPRSNQIEILVFDWLQDNVILEDDFIDQIGEINLSISQDERQPYISGSENELIEPNSLMPTIDWDLISARNTTSSGSSDPNSIEVEALLVKLDGELFTWLLHTENSTTQILEFDDSSGTLNIKREFVSKIVPDTFIIIRTEGGSDLLVPIADHLMGEKAPILRQNQKKWKRELVSLVERDGSDQILNKLAALGAERANLPNLRNWMSSTNHKPQSYADFQAITRLIGKETKTDVLWTGASSIETAHRLAGHEIRKMLLEQVKNADPASFERSGRIDFGLDVKGGGKISAMRVEDISPKTYLVHEYRIGQVFEES